MMIRTDARKTLRLSMAAAALALSGCNLQEPPPFDPRGYQTPARTAAKEYTPGPMRALPTTLESPLVSQAGTTRMLPTTASTGRALENDRMVQLSLQESIHRAVANNLDVKVAGYAPAIEGTRVIEQEAKYDPTLFTNAQFERKDNRTAFRNISTATNGQDQQNIATFQGGVRQNLESGGQVELRYQSQRTDVPHASSISVDPNPFWENQIVLQVTQPLLQNFGTEVNRARITIGRNNQRISLLDFRKQIEETVSDTEKTYWQLVQAMRDVKIDEDLLDATLHEAEILIRRQGQDVTRVQISQANLQVYARRATLIRAKAHVRDLSDQLKRLMQDPDFPVTSAALVAPENKPLEDAVHFDLQDQINSAMENRFELSQQQYRVDSAAIALDVAKNNLLPTLNLQGSVGFQGLGEDFDSARSNQTDFDNLNYTIGLQFEVPIGNRAARAIYQRALLQRQQAIDSYKNLIDSISLEVTTALREVDTTWQEIGARRQQVFNAADSLNAIQQRENAGEALTPTFVQLKLDQQERLADAQRLENEAIANYNIAISQLELRKGTLLRYNNILMDEDKLPLPGLR